MNDLKGYNQLINDVWQFFKAHFPPGPITGADEYWADVVKSGGDLYEKYGTEYAKQLVLETIAELERISKDGEEGD